MIYNNWLLAIAISVVIASCNDTSKDGSLQASPESSKTVQLKLIDSLGAITLSIPLRYDTSFSWVHRSDCGKPCDEQKYRFQPKTLPITKESGWVWLGELKDSIDRLTISHTGYFPFHDGDTAKDLVRHSHLKEELLADPNNPAIIFDTIQKINDRYYSIFAMDKADSQQVKKVFAVTTIRNNEIRFQYELLNKKNDSIAKDFIRKSIELLKTIHIERGI